LLGSFDGDLVLLEFLLGCNSRESEKVCMPEFENLEFSLGVALFRFEIAEEGVWTA